MAGLEWEREEGGSASDCDGDDENVSVMNGVMWHDEPQVRGLTSNGFGELVVLWIDILKVCSI